MISIVFVIGIIVFLIERFKPAVSLPPTDWWWSRVIFLQLCALGVAHIGHLTWEQWLNKIHLFNISSWASPFWAGLLAYVLGSFVFYWWHRARHEINWLWRSLHQMHHSPQRVESLTAFFVHPVEVMASGFIVALLNFTVFGIDLAAAEWCSLIFCSSGIFYHMNLSTPAWIGWFVQRPECHRIHHQLGAHRGNYSDLPVWDYLFGTYIAPETFSGVCGFADQREKHFLKILMWRDLHKG